MAIPNPNPNIVDGYPCDNKTYSSNKIESLIQVATELPVIHEGDAGKVLTVNADADAYELDSIPNEVPTPALADAGKVITVNAGGTGYELDSIPNELPTPASGDAGKVLTVNAGADGYELDTPVAPTSIIDDAASSASTVYSSSKVDTLLSNKADTSNTPKITSTSWGTSATVSYIRSHFIIILGSKLYAAWFAGEGLSGINIRDIGTDTNVTGTNTATNGDLTVTRTADGFTATSTSNTTITVIG